MGGLLAKREVPVEGSYNSDNQFSDDFVDLFKAKKRHPAAPSGFQRIPRSKHDGYRKRVGDHYAYWYPDGHKAEDQLDWEADVGAGQGTALIKPGHFVTVIGGPKGIFAWTPDARKASKDPQLTWVTPVSPEDGHAIGTPIEVKRGKVQPQRSRDLSRRPKKKPKPKKQPKWKTRHDPKKLAQRGSKPRPNSPEALEAVSRRERAAARELLIQKIGEAQEALDRTGRRRIRSPQRRAALKTAIVAARKELDKIRERVGGPGRMTDAPSEEARAAVWFDSTAKAGTILHKLENGAYALFQIPGGDDHFEHNKRTHGVFLPPEDVRKAFDEFSDVFDNAAAKVGRTYRTSSGPEMEDIRAGARLGFMLALRTYAGGGPFELHARRYASVYAQQAARDVISGGGATIPKRQMQMVHGLIAARARAASKAKGPPTDEQIAKAWFLTKKATFSGRSETLGTYPHPTKEDRRVNQSNEQVPLESWQVVGPDGVPHGPEYPGKLALLREVDPILDGSRVEDTDWMNMNEAMIVPTGVDPSLPLGSRYQLRQELDQVLAELPNDSSEVLTVLFGLDPVPASGADLEAPDEGRRLNPNYAVTAVELSDRLGLAKPGATRRDKQRKAKAAVEQAIRLFQTKADALGYRHIADSAKDWDQMIAPQRPEPIQIPEGPTQRELSERFGGSDKVAIYAAAVRAGNGEAVATKLDKLKAGKLSAKQRDNMMREYMEQRDQERLAEFRRQTRTRSVDPSQVKDVSTGTPGEAGWLYTPEILAGSGTIALPYRELVNEQQRAASENSLKRQSKVWTDARFQRFMGRGQQFERMKQGGDNG